MAHRQIYSKNDMFKGELVDMPLKCKVAIRNSGGKYVYKCPHCGHMATDDECDVAGAEPECLFCNQCNREFKP